MASSSTPPSSGHAVTSSRAGSVTNPIQIETALRYSVTNLNRSGRIYAIWYVGLLSSSVIHRNEPRRSPKSLKHWALLFGATSATLVQTHYLLFSRVATLSMNVFSLGSGNRINKIVDKTIVRGAESRAL